MRFQIKKGFIPAIILGLLISGGVVYAATHSPCLAPNTFEGSHHVCYTASHNNADTAKVFEDIAANHKCVQNDNTLDIFIPTNTTGEWTSFRTYAPNVSLSALNADGTCGGGGEPVDSVAGEVNVYIPPQYCSANPSLATLNAIGRVRATNNLPYWYGIRTAIANASGWSNQTKADANSVVDTIAPDPSTPFVPNGYWSGDGPMSGQITTQDGKTFHWGTLSYPGDQTDACTTNQSNHYQAEANISITGPF